MRKVGVRCGALVMGFALALGGSGCASRRHAPIGPGATPPVVKISRASGRLVGGPSGHPLVGFAVAAGGVRSVTDVDGRFDVPDGSAPYDVRITSDDQARVTVYLGLVRRDPTLACHEPGEHAKRAHHAELSGHLLAGTQSFAEGAAVQVGFVSERGDAHDLARVAAGAASADYGPLRVSWDGPAEISGQLLALQMVQGPTRGRLVSASLARAQVTLHDGAQLKLDATFGPVPIEARPADVVSAVPEPLVAETVHDYRIPGSGWAMHGVGPFRRGTDYDSPDLSGVGAVLCVDAFLWNPYKRSTVRRCGLAAKQAAELVLPDAPSFREPSADATVTRGMRFSWSPVPDAVYLLELAPEGDPSHAAPEIQLFTAQTSATWPELGDLGVEFPSALNTYTATVNALGPQRTLDELAAARGPGVPLPSLVWRATSSDLDLPVRPPLGPEEARCAFEPGSAVVCSPGIVGSIEPSQEFYMLSAINNKLRNYPEFARAIGIHCVRDCAQARAYVKAYSAYSKAHPGFDANQPLGPRPPPPPMPPGPPPPPDPASPPMPPPGQQK